MLDNLRRELSGKRILVPWTALFLVSGVGANIMFKKQTNSFINYAWFNSQLNYVLILGFYCVAAVVAYFRSYPQVNECQYRWLWLIAFFDALANLMQIALSDLLGADAGPETILLAQAVIPITMVTSTFALETRYNAYHIVGAIGIIVGVGVNTIPAFAKGNVSASVVFQLLFLLSDVPVALNKVIKQYLFSSREISLLRLGMWENGLDFICGWPLLPIYVALQRAASVRGTSSAPSATYGDQVGAELTDGAKCMFGVDTLKSDDCHDAGLNAFVFCFFGAVFGIALLGVVKNGSANYAFLLSAVLLPLTDVFFSWPLIMGEDTSEFTIYDVLAMAIMTVALMVYAYGGEDKARLDERDGHARLVESGSEELSGSGSSGRGGGGRSGSEGVAFVSGSINKGFGSVPGGTAAGTERAGSSVDERDVERGVGGVGGGTVRRTSAGSAGGQQIERSGPDGLRLSEVRSRLV